MEFDETVGDEGRDDAGVEVRYRARSIAERLQDTTAGLTVAAVERRLPWC